MAELSWLVERSRRGDLDAFGELVRRFQDMAHGYAYSILGDFHLAEDVAQEAFIDAYYKLEALREAAAFPGWFRRIVFKHCDRITRKKEVATVPLEEGKQAEQPRPARSELQEKVLNAVRDLPERQREVTTLYYIDGYSQNEIADFLEVPVTTVRKRLQHSREKLKERMLGMVEDALKDSVLPEDFARQLLMFPFPTREPEVEIEDLPGRRMSVKCKDAQTYFVPLEEAGRCDWTFYDWPSRRLTGVYECHVLGRVRWKRANVYRVWTRYTDFKRKGEAEWREDYYHIENDRWRWVQVVRHKDGAIGMSDSPVPEEPFLEGVPMQLALGTKWQGFGGGEVIGVSRVSIGETSWECLKSRGAGQDFKNKDGNPAVYYEWYVAESGRTVFFRRYNGPGFTEPDKPTSFESLKGNVQVEYQGITFRHAYDCIPDIALSGLLTEA